MTAETLTTALSIVAGTMEPRNLTEAARAALNLEGYPSRERVRERAVEILLYAFQEQQKRIEKLEAKAQKG
ncbi:hypothetical protein CCAX7_15280 [Capsulimonas corticalis]|uniref:Uncharacterized protein n=1 Tax=Capsulimonas corticalis TaxID=2219043 RepID=A0A402CZ88_9BACT|nr:hypothetical protein [Capsulimonas corticalis]BDI29477.1 hypothetical protein CCAX7_15280 [Capsulimonas corticalis]